MSDIKVKPNSSYFIRTLSKSGRTRYLSVGKIFPADWEVVKVIVKAQSASVCILRIEHLK